MTWSSRVFYIAIVAYLDRQLREEVQRRKTEAEAAKAQRKSHTPGLLSPISRKHSVKGRDNAPRSPQPLR